MRVQCIPHGIVFSYKRSGNDICFSCLELNISPYKPKPYKYLMLSTFTYAVHRSHTLEKDTGRKYPMEAVHCADSHQERAEELEIKADPGSEKQHCRRRGPCYNGNKLNTSETYNKYWFGQKVHLEFSVRCYGKTQMNFWSTQHKCAHI